MRAGAGRSAGQERRNSCDAYWPGQLQPGGPDDRASTDYGGLYAYLGRITTAGYAANPPWTNNSSYSDRLRHGGYSLPGAAQSALYDKTYHKLPLIRSLFLRRFLAFPIEKMGCRQSSLRRNQWHLWRFLGAGVTGSCYLLRPLSGVKVYRCGVHLRGAT